MPQKLIACILLLVGALYSDSSALDEQGRSTGESAGKFGLSIIGTRSGLDARSKMPLTDQNTQLTTFDGSKQRSATALCGQGSVQNQKQAVSVNVNPDSITVSSDTNNDGNLDATATFNISKVCHSGYQYNGGFYDWVVSLNGVVSSIGSASPLDGCIDASTAPPSYTGGKIAQLYSNMTGRQMIRSDTISSTVFYFSAGVNDCNNSPKDISQTKYYNDPYSMESDGNAQLSSTCAANDDYCWSYKAAPSGVQNANNNATGGSSQAQVSCAITRKTLDIKGPYKGIICEAGKLYYATGQSDTNKYCMSSQSKWDYNSMFRVRCNQYGTEMTLEGWAFWEGAPCGSVNYSNYPPDNQIIYPLSYGGNVSDRVIGTLSVNRRAGGDNIASNDLPGSAALCYSNVSPLRVYFSQSCPATNEYCEYTVHVDNAPSCGKFVITVVPPPAEDITNTCTTFEQQAGCKLKSEKWYDAQGNQVYTMKDGTPTNNPQTETCKTLPTAGTVCKEWFRKSRSYQCEGILTAGGYSADTSRAMAAATSANNDAGNAVQFAQSSANKENTNTCLLEVIQSGLWPTESECVADGGSMKAGECQTKQYLKASCKYHDPSAKAGLYCDTSTLATIFKETSRRVYRDCLEQNQCNVSCVLRVPDASQPSGYGTQSVSCNPAGNNTYTCPNGGNTIVKDCDCSIDTWDPAKTQGEECQVSCLVDQYGYEASSNVTRDFLLLACNKTYVPGLPTPQYTCPLSAGQTLHKDCACADTFALSAGVLGAISQALKDRECQ